MAKVTIAILLMYSAISVAATELPKAVDLGVRHQASGLNSSFPGHLQNFEQYIDHYRQVVSNARTDLTAANREWVIEGNTPFQLKPAAHCEKRRSEKYQRGIILTHGLTDSVYQMRHLAKYFQRQCFYVMVVLLPGHGARPGDLLEVLWQDWSAATDFVFEQMAQRAEDVYMAGYSMGATLTLLKASQDSRVKGVFAFSPAVKISSLAAFAGVIDLLGGLSESMRWLTVANDEDYFKYESFPHNAVSQIHQLLKAAAKSIAKHGINIPVFMVASAQDSTVEVEKAIELMKTFKHTKNRMLLYSQYQRSEPKPIRVINSHFPAKRQLSLAHIGLSIPGGDPYYGENGAYRNCIHYYDGDNEDYIRCKRDKQILVGETTPENLQQGIMARATYNFLYRQMLIELGDFIKAL